MGLGGTVCASTQLAVSEVTPEMNHNQHRLGIVWIDINAWPLGTESTFANSRSWLLNGNSYKVGAPKF